MRRYNYLMRRYNYLMRRARMSLRLLAIGLVCAAFVVASDAAGSKRRNGRFDRVVVAGSDMVVVPAGWFSLGVNRTELHNLARACNEQLGRSKWKCESVFVGIAERDATLFALRNIRLRRRLSKTGYYHRRVYLGEFEIDRYEVTVANYRKCVAAGVCSISSLVAGDTRYLRDRWPMVNVTWDDASKYCLWRGKRLPTEAEWEKAARGTRAWRWTWGNQIRKRGANHGKVESPAITLTRGYLFGSSAAVYMTAPDASDGARYAVAPGVMVWSEGPYGTFDMSGNVAEWVYDYWSPQGYKGLGKYNPVRRLPVVGHSWRVIRGGSWMMPKIFSRTYMRMNARNMPRSEHVGFRCARSQKKHLIEHH